jgi:hypothetical protein
VGRQLSPGWEVAADAAEVHGLLLASDAEQAARYAIPAPRRNPATTERRVAAGEVGLLRIDGVSAGAFTLSADPPFEVSRGMFPTAARPMYLSRLCVAPAQLRTGSLVGVRCLREAIAAAARARADVLRSQANPDFADVLAMLQLHGFRRHGPVAAHGQLRSVNLQKDLSVISARAVPQPAGPG